MALEIRDNGDVLGVHELHVRITRREILVLMGLSGSGKSTSARPSPAYPIARDAHTIECGRETLMSAAGRQTAQQMRHGTRLMVFQQFRACAWRSVG